MDLVSPAPFIGEVTNPFAASGGRNVEQHAETLRRGPEEIRARGRAVTPADYVLLVQQVPGADVARVHTIPGRDIRFPGAAVAGTVSVLLVSSDRGASPPIPDAGTFEQVAAFTLLDRVFSLELGEVTPKLSLCRGVIHKQFAPQIEAMYRSLTSC